jgi:serine/threonine protein kinase
MGIVHRDIKPSNVLLDTEGAPHLTDFGVSRLIDEAGATRAGTVIGTAAYLAPEQVRGQATGPAADIYALALLLIECLTGRREYPGPPAEAAIARLQRSPTVPQGLPTTLARLLRGMTATEPERRPPADRCAELLGRLDRPDPAPFPALPVASTTVTPSLQMPLSTRRRHGHRSLLAGTALLAGAGLAWGTVAATADPAPRSPASTTSAPRQATTTPVLAAALAPTPSTEPNEPSWRQPVGKKSNNGNAHGHGHGHRQG